MIIKYTSKTLLCFFAHLTHLFIKDKKKIYINQYKLEMLPIFHEKSTIRQELKQKSAGKSWKQISTDKSWKCESLGQS